jgi:hypothetical protein
MRLAEGDPMRLTPTPTPKGLFTAIAILLQAPLLWAAEPASDSGEGWSAVASEPTAPTAEPASPAVASPAAGAAAAGVPADSPNAVAASPYESAPTLAEAAPPPPPRRTEPATLFDSTTDFAIGGFGGLAVQYTRFAGTNAAQVCLEGALIIDHALTFGGGGCGITSMVDGTGYGEAPHYDDDRLTFGYGGAIIRYHFLSRELANVSIGALIGAGGVTVGRWGGSSGNDWEENFTERRSEAVFVFEPQLGGHLNITRWMRVGASAGYRLVGGTEMKGLSSSDLNGPTLGGHLHLGWF